MGPRQEKLTYHSASGKINSVTVRRFLSVRPGEMDEGRGKLGEKNEQQSLPNLVLTLGKVTLSSSSFISTNRRGNQCAHLSRWG